MRAIRLLGAALAFLPIAAGATETITYTYDAKGRLTGATHNGSVNNGIASIYAFDRADNRVSHSIVGGPTAVVANPSFEQPSLGGWYAYQPSTNGVTFTQAAGITGNNGAWGFTAPDGAQVAFLQTGGVASTVSVAVSGLAPGATYAVRFKRQARPGFAPNQLTVIFGGQALGTFSAGTSFQTATSAPFQATAATGTITFSGEIDAVDRATGIDAIEVVRSP